MVSLGASTNSVYTRLSQGNFASSVSTSSWVSSLTNRLSTTTVAMSANAQYQLALSQSSISTSVLYTSTLGLSPSSWSTLSGASGLPNFSTVSYTAGAISGDGRYGLLGTASGVLSTLNSGGGMSAYITNNYGASYTSTLVNPPYVYLPFNNSLTDVYGNSVVTVPLGSISYVTGVIGTNALSITNTAGNNPTNYVQGTLPTIANGNLTVTGWVNFQSLPTGANRSVVFTVGRVGASTSNAFYLEYVGGVGLQFVYYRSSDSAAIPVAVYNTVSINTWYNFICIWQNAGICSFYINNILVGTTAGAVPITSTITGFTLGTYTNQYFGAFNGYIDDFRIYFNTLTFPMTYNNVAVSNTGQYMLATVTNGGLYMSSNFGSTWTQVTGVMLSALWSNAQVSATGQYMLVNAQPQIVQPQLTGLTGSTTVVNAVTTWQVNGITWTCSASSSSGAMQNPYMLFNNTLFDNYWVSASTYNVSTGVYNGTQSTIVNGQGTVVGEYVQLQSSVPIQFQSYTFASGSYLQYPNTFTFAGSNDGINWYLLQSVTMSGNPVGTAAGSTSTSYIIINQSGTQTMTTNVTSVTFTCTTSQYSANLYTYIRFIIPSVFGTSGFTALTEVYFRFNAGGQTYSTNYGSTWSSGLPLYTIIQPQLAGISTTTWQTNGNTWISSASTSQGGTTASYLAFNNAVGSNNTWASAGTYTAGTGVYTGSVSTPNIVGTGTYTGEWLQIQSSSPIVMNSYSFANGGNANGNQAPRIYQIVGSNDGSTWYTIQTVTVTGNPYTAVNTYANTIIVNSSGTFAGSNGSSYAVTTTTFTTGAYSYFRLCVNATIPGSFGAAELGEWVINFTSSIQTSQALSESGQYALNSYIPGTIVPQQTGLTTNTWNQGGVGWTASASTVLGNLFYAYNLFNNNYGIDNRWVSSSTTYTTSGNSSGIFTTILGGIGSIQGDWVQLQSSVPLIMNSYQFGNGYLNTRLPKTYYIIGSNDSINWYPIQYGSGGTVPTIGQYTLISSIIIINSASTQTFGTSTITTTIYPTTTTAYLYFRIVCMTTYNSSTDYYLDISEWNINFTGPTNTSLYNVVSPLTGLSTNTYLAGTIPGAITNSAISNTGQYMVILTNNTAGNNVYYSTNYGATFTGLQLGTATLTSCAMSYDGSYMTIASGATVYTLNNNSTGFSLALGNQAGAQNQANNAIAIGNYAGYQNQAANSIILNASGSAVNSFAPGFYVAPIASYTASSSQTFALLGYGTDSQVVQIGNVSMTSNILTLNSGLSLTGTVYGATTASAAFWMQANGNTSLFITDSQNSATMGTITMGRYFGVGGNIFQDFTGSFIWRTSNLSNTAVNTAMTLSSTGVLTVANVSIFGNSSQSLINIGANSNCSSGGSAGNNMSIGINVGRTAGTGSNNLLYGMVVGQNMTTANFNMLFGLNSGNAITTGIYNHCFGVSTLNMATTASYNTCIGFSGRDLTTGAANTFLGHNVGNTTTTGNRNVVIGIDIPCGTTTEGNILIGGQGTAPSITTATYNVCIGVNAGGVITSGSFNMYLGTNVNASSATVTKEIVLNSSDNTATGKGTNTFFVASANSYNGANSTAWTTISDRRIKRNITDVSNGLNIILALHPVEFDYIVTNIHDTGFIAQEYQNILPNQITHLSATGIEIDLVGEGNKIMGIQQNLVPYLVKAIQEQNAIIAAQQAQIDTLIQRLAAANIA